MTIRSKLLLLGAMPVLALAFLLHAKVAEGVSLMRARDEARACFALSEVVSAAIHELQRERGLSVGRMAGGDAVWRDELARQTEVTDRRLESLASAHDPACGAANPAATAEALASLPSLRDEVGGLRGHQIESHAGYTRLIAVLTSEMVEIGHAMGVGKPLHAHAHLIAAKEFMGQIRATVTGILSQGGATGQALGALTMQKGQYEARVVAFLKESSPALGQTFQRGLDEPASEATWTTIASLLRGEALAVGAREWFHTVTAAIDILRAVEESSLDEARAAAQETVSAFGRQAALQLAFGVGAGLVVLLATAMLLRDVVGSIGRLSEDVAEIVASRDFSMRLAEGRVDEIGVISRGFNAVLEVAEQVICEKDDLARTDPLTGAANRRAFSAALDDEIERSGRYGGTFSLLAFDADKFKLVNDTFGHQVGDQVLLALTRVVSAHIRTNDLLARLGGEEFAVLLPATDREGAAELAEKLRRAIEDYPMPGAGRVTCSFGIAEHRRGECEASLIERADSALYRAKRSGRNRVEACALCDGR
ncbi:MAG: diguanylate cyclase [Alphaproteobacteria bacterium]|nr:diguanylate cyclase [Alphaproteobacteria bacterium]